MDEEIFRQYIDPLNRTVSVSSNTWEFKQVIHPEIRGKEDILQKVFEEPNFIYESKDYTNRDVYFWYTTNIELGSGLNYAMGIVEFSESTDYGEMVSIYGSTRIHGVNVGGLKYFNKQNEK
ncbi:MAG: hypothetical protein FXF54_04710 [Kosmotoga sp.]|nr:MAG: hypothetical protein FXF54_04710 [Kosmotoga sp.]